LSFTAPSHFTSSAFKSSSNTSISLNNLFKSIFAYKQRDFLTFLHLVGRFK
jgi:hypothetical protein